MMSARASREGGASARARSGAARLTSRARHVGLEGPGDLGQAGLDGGQAVRYRRGTRDPGLAERGGLADALGEQDPGGVAVRQHGVGLVEQLEAGPAVRPG